jgi:hypothetical protein
MTEICIDIAKTHFAVIASRVNWKLLLKSLDDVNFEKKYVFCLHIFGILCVGQKQTGPPGGR